MERWRGKVAIVTGASSGIGAATVKALASAGMITFGLARRVERVEALKDELPEDARERLHALRCDVTKEEDILAAFREVEQRCGGVDVLINNAGVARSSVGVLDAKNTQELRDVIDTNLVGLALCSREAYQSMKKRSVDGHIVHINSILGHKVIPMNTLNVYPATKYGVTALTETMRHELRMAGTKIKVTSISPGLVRTEIIGNSGVLNDMPILEPEDIANGILYVLGTPPRVQVHELMIKPVARHTAMERWRGKVAIVTGASSGIGAVTVKALANAGMITFGLARRVERVDELKKDLSAEAADRLHSVRCDVTKEEDILAAFQLVEEKCGGVDVLINNAGQLKRAVSVLDAGNTQVIRDVIDTNVVGLALCSREAFQSMKRRSVDGHIVHINSILGHTVATTGKLNVYPASKFAVTALTETMRHELRLAGTKIKVTSISPGLVRTEMPPSTVFAEEPCLEPEDIADAVLYVLGTPPRVQIHELTIKPVGEK
uniref:Dehydrogenase n=2 Tax=gambiae species complex TaxID=44542 RepID=A0A8W7PWA0_ANOCL